MSSLWRVLALAWLGAGAPSAAQDSLLPDQIVARAAETGGDDRMITLGSDGRDRPAVLYRRAPGK